MSIDLSKYIPDNSYCLHVDTPNFVELKQTFKLITYSVPNDTLDIIGVKTMLFLYKPINFSIIPSSVEEIIICSDFNQSLDELTYLPNLKVLTIYSDSFNQPIHIHNLTDLILHCPKFNNYLDLPSLVYINLDCDDFDQPIEHLTNLQICRIHSIYYSHSTNIVGVDLIVKNDYLQN